MGRLTKTPYLVLFIILGGIVVSTATAMVMVTISGNFTVTGDSDLQGNVGVGGTLTPEDYANGSIRLVDLSPEIRLLLGVPTCPNPNPLGFVYEGQVTTVNDSIDPLVGGINVGETIRGVYCYAPNAPDEDNTNPEIGTYVMEFYSIIIGDDIFDCVSSRLQIFNVASQTRDGYDLSCQAMSSLLDSFLFSSSFMQLSDSDQTVFVDDSLPQSAPDLNEFEQKTFSWHFGNFAPSNFVQGTITSLVQIQ